ncbi:MULTISPECIES: hypothetical protein [Mycobacterium ulcerans group]|uniref:hypothetical protein n=1 Tax=Mycobacterium ulcerans group TaxID=2993898 RepID=UPI0022393E44|nr:MULTISPECIES: hypothetical protein [Mycobacterium ulcerans group]
MAAGLGSAASALAGLAAQPLVHPPLATDAVSMSAAARLSGHGAVVASRALDGAAVLEAGAQAITQAALGYAAMDEANRAVVSLQGSPGAPTPTLVSAVTADVVAPEVPIAAPAAQPAETTAAMIEAGRPAAGDGFVSGCAALSKGFREGAVSARSAAIAVSEHLSGQAGPRISAALNRYADWAQEMAGYAEAVGQHAGDHKSRFGEVKHATPTTSEFTHRHRELQNAIQLNSSFPSPGSAAAVSQAHANLVQLTNRTHVVAAGYHTSEIPAAPSGPPPPVSPIVEPGGGQGDTTTPVPTTQSEQEPNPTESGPDNEGHDERDVDADSDDLDELGVDGELAADPLGAGGAGSLPGMASAVPAMLTGALGAGVGMAGQIPQKLGQQLQGLAQEATQGMTGLASGLTGAEGVDIDSEGLDGALGGFGAGSGGGGGLTEPAGAGGVGDVAPAGSAPSGMGLPTASASPRLTGAGGVSGAAVPAVAGSAGVPPMFMPPMGAGMGAGGGAATRNVKEPDKSIEMPSRPNSEPVKGQGRGSVRHTAVADVGAAKDNETKRTVIVRSRSRQVDPDNNKKGDGQ